MFAAHLAAWLALAWSATLAWLAMGAVICRARLARRFAAGSTAIQRTSTGPSVLIMRPCAGAEPDLLGNLVSLTTARSSLPLHAVLAVDDPADAARPAIDQALVELRAAGIMASFECIPNRGPNRKASILAGVLEGHRDHELVINIDSNVDLAGFEFDRLIAPLLADEGIGTIWVPWSERPGVGGRAKEGLGARASEALLGGSLTAFPLLCGIHPKGLVGKFWVAPRSAIDRIGFAELVDYLGEDLELARRLLAAGLRIEAASLLVRSPGGPPTFAAAIERFTRWMLVVRAQQTLLSFSYPALFFATPMVLVLAGFGAIARPDLGLIAAGLALLGRAIVALSARHWSGRGLAIGPALVDAVLADLVLGLAWLRAWTSREVAWRGHRLRIDRGGRLRSLDRSPERSRCQ